MSEQRDIAERGFDEVAGVVAPTDHARVTVGPLAESADAWVRYRAEVARYYGAEGPVELAVVDRIVSLQARLRRLERAERGSLVASTVGIHWRQHTSRVRKAGRAQAFAAMQAEGVLATSNAVAAQRALVRLDDFIGQAKDQLPSAYDAGQMLALLYGVESQDPLRFCGRGDTAFLFYRLAMTPPPSDEPDGAQLVANVRAAFLAELDHTREALAGLIEGLNDDDKHTDIGRAEAEALPTKGLTKAVVDLERHLQQQVREAVRELERMVARRRLGEVGRRLRRR